VKFINEKYHLELPENDENYDTLGGLILQELESIPEEGVQLNIGEFECKIMAVSDRRIEKILLRKKD
jgi:CBS domain containing-hemolysin-like protein